jgi:(p)ppGpp synthase/HD superfamily hydrolase
MNKAETDFILKANNFAISKHLGQKDDEGKDYYLQHLVPVQTMIFMLSKDVEVIAAAVLHVVLEYTETTYDELVENFGKRVADLVHEVTHEGSKDEYGFYFPRLHSKEAILIKLIDRANNISRMDSWDVARREHYLKRTKFWKDGKDRKNIC